MGRSHGDAWVGAFLDIMSYRKHPMENLPIFKYKLKLEQLKYS